MNKSFSTLLSLTLLSLSACSEKSEDPEIIVTENTPATFTGVSSANISNDLVQNISNVINAIDEDSEEDAFNSLTNLTSTYGTFSITASGNWSYILDTNNSDVSSLSSGATLTDEITITSVDGTSTTINIVITGADSIEVPGGEGGSGGINIENDVMGFDSTEGGNHIDGYTDAVPSVSCSEVVNSISALEDAADNLSAGDTLCLADGNYSGDLELRIDAMGTSNAPITVAAQNSGEAIISNGEISVRLGGKHIVLQGFVFRDGESGSSIIKLENQNECYFCRVTEISIIDMDGGDYESSKWLEYYGQYNRIDHNWFSGKESRGALLVLPRWIDESTFNSSGFPEDRAQIDYNYIGNRPPAFGRAYAASDDNEYEGVRLGLSTTHSAPSYSTVEYNYFEKIQGEAEVISNKSANNTIHNNTIRNSHGSIVTRHGRAADISNNYVLGDDHPFSGGIRLVDDGHTVTNNYIQGARYLSSNWNGGIVLTAGDGAGDTDNGYQNVSNVFIAHNTIVDSVNSLNVFGGKYDEAPKNIYLINNIIGNAIGPVIRTNDEGLPSNSIFEGNYVFGDSFSDDNSVTIANTSGFDFVDLMFEYNNDNLFRATTDTPDITAALPTDIGSFELPTTDVDGLQRLSSTTSGASTLITDASSLTPLSVSEVGPKNYRPTPGQNFVELVNIDNHDFDDGSLTGWTNEGGNGAEIVSDADAFSRNHTLKLNSNSAKVSQVVPLSANTNYTLSAFMKGTAKLTALVDGQSYSAERASTSYGFASVSFNSGSATSAIISATVDDLIKNLSNIVNPNFDEGQDSWTVVEGTGIGQVQDSDNSASGSNGSIKFKYNSGEDSGTPHNPYIAQTVIVEPNSNYTLSIYNLYKEDNDNSSLIFGVSDNTDVTISSDWIVNKDSVYSSLESAGNDKGDDNFYKDTLSFNSGSQTSVTVFAQYKSSTGDEIRVDEFELSYQGAPVEGTAGYFDSIRLVSHPLSPSESDAKADD